MRKFVLILIFLNAPVLASFGQTNESNLQLLIDEGLILMNKKAYQEANDKFTIVIDKLKPLPNRMAFYFGKNSYFLGEFKQSINWLSKYIQLKGTNGTFYEDAKLYLELSEKKYLETNQQSLTDIEDNLDNDFECYSQTKMTCPACKGSGVLITKGLMRNNYETCPISGSDGYLTCEEYNLFLKGKLISKKKKSSTSN